MRSDRVTLTYKLDFWTGRARRLYVAAVSDKKERFYWSSGWDPDFGPVIKYVKSVCRLERRVERGITADREEYSCPTSTFNELKKVIDSIERKWEEYYRKLEEEKRRLIEEIRRRRGVV
jgi:hypothetical protein